MKYGKKIDVLKPQTLFPRNFLGNYRGYSEETWFLGIFSFNRVNQAAKYFAKIELMISEENPTEIFNHSEEIPTDIFRRTPHFIRSNQIFFPISLFLSPPNAEALSRFPANTLFSLAISALILLNFSH